MARVRTAGLMMALIGLPAGAWLTGCHASKPAGQIEQTEPLAILEHFNGFDDPAFKNQAVRVFNSRKELDAFDAALARGLHTDFSTHTLLVLALGRKPTGGFWARITGVQRLDGELFVQGTANAPAPGQPVLQAITYPYYAVLIPKVEPKIIHPEIQSVVGQRMP